MTEELDGQKIATVTEATPSPDEELFEVEVEVAAGSEEAPAKKAPDDDDGDDDSSSTDDDDERLNADQREDVSSAQLKRRNRRRKENRRREVEAQDRREFQMRAFRAEHSAVQSQAQILQMQAHQVDRDIMDATRAYQHAERASAAAMSKNDGVAFQQWERKKQEAAARYQEQNTLKARLGHGYQQLQSQWNEMSHQMQAEPAMRMESDQREQPAPITDSHKRHAESFVSDNAWIADGGKDSEVMRKLDIEVMEDGFDPSTKAYWTELGQRAKAAMPGRYRTVTRTSPPVGTGRDISANKRTMRFPASVVQTCKDAGYWDNPKDRNDYFNRVLAAQKTEQTRTR